MIRVLELFGGYGSQALALENLGIEFKSDLCDIDKYAIQAYNQIHGETFNYGDICSIDETKLPYYDLITYSSPCQDFSQAGKQAGGEKGSGTRSSLLWECERIIRAVKPKYLLMENVKALTSKKFMPLFAKWLRTLEDMGYKNWWKVLNAKDYGVPQNRERVFVVSILGGGNYQFPDPMPLTKRLKDVLEQNVDEKYYINKPFNTYPDGTSRTIKAQYYKNSTSNFERTDSFGATGVLEPVCCASRGRNPDNPSDRTTGSPTEQIIEINTNGTTNTITTVQKDNYVIEPKVETHIIPQTVSVRKYDVDIRKLQAILRMQKETLGLTNKQISEKLNKPLTNVEHWFRTDDGFSIPEKDVWFSLKELLNIGTNEFDDSITTFEEKENVFEKANRCYGVGGVSPTLTATSSDEKIIEPKVMQEPMNLYPNSGNPQAGRVYNTQGISPAMDTCQGGGLEPKITEVIGSTQKNAFHGDGTISPSLTSAMGMGGGQIPMCKYENFRIRKLTPRECWRLMGVKDEQFDKLHDISNSQLYKMAGNSIVVDVLIGIFKNMFMPEEQEQKGQLELF